MSQTAYGIANTARPIWACIVFLCLLPSLSPAADKGPDRAPWLLVDTTELTLTVMSGGQPKMTLHNIAIGRYGTSPAKRRGDNNTPLGRFRVAWIKRNSGFHRFIGLDYPDVERAEKGYQEGVIDNRELQAIRNAHRRGRRPPQDTALGGQIGIHGLGRADPNLHESMNWTRGCVALTDHQVDALLSWVRIGTAVEIR